MEHSPVLPAHLHFEATRSCLNGAWTSASILTVLEVGGGNNNQYLRALDWGSDLVFESWVLPLMAIHFRHIVQIVLRNLCPHLQNGKIAFTSK